MTGSTSLKMATIKTLTLEQEVEWRDLLSQNAEADVYFHPGYLKPLAQRGEGRPLLFVFTEGERVALHIVLLRPLDRLPFSHAFADKFDSISPYGYAGPLLPDPTWAGGFWKAWAEYAAAQGIVAEFIRFHPLLSNHEPFRDWVALRQAGSTIWMDLTVEVETNLSKSRRRHINYALRQGVKVERVGPEFIPQFTRMYQDTMRRKEAAAYYFFDEAYFHTLYEGLGEDFWLMRASAAGRDCAYKLCLRAPKFLHYHLGCSAAEMADYRADNLLYLESARAGQQAGCVKFHLGGGYRGEDSLFAFKALFSPHRAAFYVGQVVHDAAVVAELTHLAQAAGVMAEDPLFFPPYRSAR